MSKRSGRRGNCDQTGLAGNRGWFFRKLGSKKEGGSQQIEYKLPNLHSRVEPLQRRTLSRKSQGKCCLRTVHSLADEDRVSSSWSVSHSAVSDERKIYEVKQQENHFSVAEEHVRSPAWWVEQSDLGQRDSNNAPDANS